jgi:hypothetical protein
MRFLIQIMVPFGEAGDVEVQVSFLRLIDGLFY